MDQCPNCGKIYRIGLWNFPCNGSGDHALGAFYKGDSNIHTSERVTLIRNPTTGETRPPGRGDRPIHHKYIEAGFTEKTTLDTHQQIRQYEKEKGVIHESSWYDTGSGKAERDTNSR